MDGWVHIWMDGLVMDRQKAGSLDVLTERYIVVLMNCSCTNSFYCDLVS